MKENVKKKNPTKLAQTKTPTTMQFAALGTQCRVAFARWTNPCCSGGKNAANTHWIKSVEKQTCSNLKHIIILSIRKCLESVSCYEHIHPFTG